MRDQAAGLRCAAPAARPAPAPCDEGPAAFAVGSGKGGVGKSALAVLLARSLARGGRRVLLFDGALNQANLHVLLGCRPAAGLTELLHLEVEPAQLVVPVADGLWLLPGDSGAEAVHALTGVEQARLHRRLTGVFDAFDAVVVDSGPGIEGVVRATLRATRLTVVTTPDPAALSDAYAVIKILTLQMPTLPLDVLVNRAAGAAEAEAVFARLALGAEQFLRRRVESLGFVPELDAVSRAARRPGRLLELAVPEMGLIAAALLEREAAARAGGGE
jgi:flagellar biosynthesis protein FlhG